MSERYKNIRFQITHRRGYVSCQANHAGNMAAEEYHGNDGATAFIGPGEWQRSPSRCPTDRYFGGRRRTSCEHRRSPSEQASKQASKLRGMQLIRSNQGRTDRCGETNTKNSFCSSSRCFGSRVTRRLISDRLACSSQAITSLLSAFFFSRKIQLRMMTLRRNTAFL